MKHVKSIGTALFIGLVACVVVIVSGNMAMAKVTGICSTCHTMHNSQGGGDDGGGGAPRAFLTKAGNENICVGCHTDNGGPASAPLVDITPGFTGEYVTGVSAGGTFEGDCTAVHNVQGIDTVDTGITDGVPPGYNNDRTGSPTWTAGSLTCAGTYGCHGDPSVEGNNDAIKGAHHTNDASVQNTDLDDGGDTVGESYRFLLGVVGMEDTTLDGSRAYDWKENRYWAAEAGTGETISELCCECHGKFHTEAMSGDDYTGDSSPFYRHPTDRAIDTSENTGLVADVEDILDDIPIGWVGDNAVTDETDVICISCHYSHGSSEDDILRFNYGDMLAGETNSTEGCLACHVRQQ